MFNVGALFGYGESSKESRGSQVTTVQMPAQTEAEKELIQLQLEMARINKAQAEAAAKSEAEFATSPEAAMQKKIQQLAEANILGQLTGEAPVLTPGQTKLLDMIYGTAERRGSEDLTRFAENLAASRGMTTADSPIGNEFLRQRREFGEGLAAQRAASTLNLGEASNAFNAQLAQFQASLRQQAFNNRMALAGLQPGSTGLGAWLSQERLGGRNTYQRATGKEFMSGWNVQGSGGWQGAG